MKRRMTNRQTGHPPARFWRLDHYEVAKRLRNLKDVLRSLYKLDQHDAKIGIGFARET
jgi:hypothetical protein